MAKTFSFSRHSRFVNQFKSKKGKAQETNEFEFKTNYKKSFKTHQNLIAKQADIAKMFEDMKNQNWAVPQLWFFIVFLVF